MLIIDPSTVDPLALPSVSLEERAALPTNPCVYFALDREGKVQYIGKSNNPRRRWQAHHRGVDLALLGGVRIAYLESDVNFLAEIERALIACFRPPLNQPISASPSLPSLDPSGWLEKYTKNKKLKNGTIATYPRVEGVRDPDNSEHWFWSYRYEEKSQKALSDNGFITRTIYLEKNKVEAVKLAIGCGWTIQKILRFIQDSCQE